MSFKFYNTCSRQIEEFKPQEPGLVKMYNCGPTVYDHPHIGNFRSFLFADTLRRALEFAGLNVRQIMNITDVGHLTVDDIRETGEDKLEAAAKKQGLNPMDIANTYKKEFEDCLEILNFRKAEKYPRATDHIEEMKEMIVVLIAKGFAYEVNGNVYFDVSKFPNYGKLSNNTLEQLRAGARIDINPEKRNPVDFALWKRDPKHLMQWPSPWGQGFPGWHIECSAMSRKYLGDTLDIHTGGEDNIFPHHECEIAQSEGFTGKSFVRMWMHGRHLLVNGRKMSKSEGTFFTIKDILDKGYEPMVLRYLLVSVHYRTNLNFTLENLDACKSALERLRLAKGRLLEFMRSESVIEKPHDGMRKLAREGLKLFAAALEEDLNMSVALRHVFDFVTMANKFLDEGGVDAEDAQEGLAALMKMDSVVGVLEKEEVQTLSTDEENMIRQREEARKRKDFQSSDKIRSNLRQRGIILEDTKSGTKWRRIR